MPKMTLLDIVQDILNDMDSDQVNSIDDTFEASQVAAIVKSTFYDMVGTRQWPPHLQTMTLQAVGNADYPTFMRIPEGVYEIKWIKYNMKDQMSDATGLEEYKDVKYLAPDQFIDMVYMRDADASNSLVTIDNLTGSGTRFVFVNDADPTYWTSFDDEYVIFDSYNSTYDDTLQQQKSLTYAWKEPSWTMSDTFVPDIPAKYFSLFLSECKSAAMVKVKQMQDPIEARRVIRNRNWLANEKWRHKKGTLNYPNYGRK